MDYYYSFKQYLKRLHHQQVWRIPLSTGYPCPNRIDGKSGCTFCDGSSFIAPYIREGADLETQIRKGIEFFGKKFKADLFYGYFQENSSTFGPLDILEGLYRIALEEERIAGLIISTRPDQVDARISAKIADLAREYGKPAWIELGLQSVHDVTLQRVNRNHTYADFRRAARDVKEAGLLLGIHMILGLPGETPHMMEESVGRLVGENRIDGIKFRLLDVIPGTPIADEYARVPEDFHHFTMEGYIGLICNLLELLPPDCVILRSFDYNPACNLFKEGEVQLSKDDLLRHVRYEFDRRGSRQGIRWSR
jgi:radical SAM protein (TIGR01212 family)